MLAVPPGVARATDVTTYHYDNLRTGWNPQETVLTPANVGGASFGVLKTVRLDNVVFGQPLIVTGVKIGKAIHTLAYVVTNNNTVYAIDTIKGQRLITKNLGPTVPKGARGGTAKTVGAQSTPVIDLASQTLYVISYTYENSEATYRLHALDLSTLTDKVPSVVISATHTLVDGSTATFVPGAQRNRPALLEANGNIYAAFGSFGDHLENVARGWMLGFNAATLAPVIQTEVTNDRATSIGDCQWHGSGPCFLTSLWMSGFGVAADDDGNLFMATANSDPGTYDGVTNFQESAIKMSGDLSKILDFFTPAQVTSWDQHDHDFGSGGVGLLPDQPGTFPHLAVAAGKSGTLYLINRDQMGGARATHSTPLDSAPIGACWCGPSYFEGPDREARIVASGGDEVTVFTLSTQQATTHLAKAFVSPELPTGQDAGFFTSVSSSGTAAGTAIIWAVTRPQSVGDTVKLVALDASDGSILYTGAAGPWKSPTENSNAVPVVANGEVFVTTATGLTIFGLGADSDDRAGPATAGVSPDRPQGHEVYGTVETVDGATLTLKLRTGSVITVDASEAIAAHESVEIEVGEALAVDGDYDAAGVLEATWIIRAKSSPKLWPPDQ